MKEFLKKNEIKIIFTVFIILSAVYLSLVWNKNVWMDEAFTASLVHTDFRGVIERSMADTLPPLYNIILKLATDVFGYTIPVMKITSVVPMLLTLLLGATVVRKRFGFRTALLFMLFITFMPLFMYYGVEIRMYSLGFFFATASGIYAYEIVCEPSAKNWTAFTLLSTLAGYSHHFAFVTVAFAYFYLLLSIFSPYAPLSYIFSSSLLLQIHNRYQLKRFISYIYRPNLIPLPPSRIINRLHILLQYRSKLISGIPWPI